jgi:hypothetical protein
MELTRKIISIDLRHSMFILNELIIIIYDLFSLPIPSIIILNRPHIHHFILLLLFCICVHFGKEKIDKNINAIDK